MATDKKPLQPPPHPSAPPPNHRLQRGKKARADNKLLLPDARWQRFQHYVWDKKKG